MAASTGSGTFALANRSAAWCKSVQSAGSSRSKRKCSFVAPEVGRSALWVTELGERFGGARGKRLSRERTGGRGQLPQAGRAESPLRLWPDPQLRGGPDPARGACRLLPSTGATTPPVGSERIAARALLHLQRLGQQNGTAACGARGRRASSHGRHRPGPQIRALPANRCGGHIAASLAPCAVRPEALKNRRCTTLATPCGDGAGRHGKLGCGSVREPSF